MTDITDLINTGKNKYRNPDVPTHKINDYLDTQSRIFQKSYIPPIREVPYHKRVKREYQK